MSDTTDLYVTATETLYPEQTSYGEVVVRLYGRTRDHERRAVTVRGFQPHFYVRAGEQEDVQPAEHSPLVGYEETGMEPLSDRFDPAEDTTDLVKVVAEKPGDIPRLRKLFEKSWAADTIFTERFRIERGVETGVTVPDDARDGPEHFDVEVDDIEPVELTDIPPRWVTLDIETDDRSAGFPDPGDARVLSIVAYDSYSEEYVGFLDLNGRSVAEHFELESEPEGLDDLGIETLDQLYYNEDERSMLSAFADWIQGVDPDLLTGWNSADDSTDGFDFPHILERMAEVGVPPGRLSPERNTEVIEAGDDFRAEVTGRALYDLMDGWADKKFTQPRSKKLDDVAQKVLDDAKIPHPGRGFYELYRDAPAKFLEYNATDTRLTVDICKEANVLGYKKRLKDMVGVDWHRTHENNEFIEMSVRRKCAEHGLVLVSKYDNPHTSAGDSSGKSDDVNYEGAYVFPSFSDVLENVLGIDLASLYPMTQWMLNASPDTKVDQKWAWKNDIPHVVAENGACFRTDKDSIIRELVDEYRAVKAEFKQKRNQAEYGTAEYAEYAETYNVTKTIYNSYYGYTGWDRSPLYDPEIAAAVTLTGQRVIKRTAEFVNEESRGEVVYGDTDSCYVQFPDEWDQEETLEYAEDLCDVLSNDIYPELCEEFRIDPENNRWDIELEMRAERFFQSGSKKRYAYLKTWDEGDDFDEQVDSVDITGYDCVKSNTARITEDVQEDVLEMIVRGEDNETIAERVFEATEHISARDPDWEYVGIPQGLRQRIDPDRADQDGFYSWSKTGDHPQGENPRAVWFANHLLDVEFAQGSKPKRSKVKETHTVQGESVDVIAFDDGGDLQTADREFKMDVEEMQRKTLRNPLEDILDAVGMDVSEALKGNCVEETQLSAFM